MDTFDAHALESPTHILPSKSTTASSQADVLPPKPHHQDPISTPHTTASAATVHETLKIAYFCGTLERNKDGVTRTLEHLRHYNTHHAVDSLFITAVADGAWSGDDAHDPYSVRTVEVAGVPVPKYEGYRLSVATPLSIERSMAERNFTPSLVHLHTPCTLGLAGLAVARHAQVPVIATYHTHFPSYFRHHNAALLEQPARSYLRQFYNRCDAVIVPSKELQRELQSDGIRNTVYLPHGVDTKAFHPLFRSYQWRERMLGKDAADKTVLLYVGRLVWEKNLRILVDAIKPLLAEHDNLALAIVGTGPAEAELRQMLPEAYFLGFQTGFDLARAFASSDIFFFPSDTETFGNVTLEAMASGLPCIVADAGGSKDLVEDCLTGFLCHPQRAEEFRDAVVTLLERPMLRQTMSYRAFVEAQKYQWDVVLGNLHALYADVVRRHRRRLQVSRHKQLRKRLHVSNPALRRLSSSSQTALSSSALRTDSATPETSTADAQQLPPLKHRHGWSAAAQDKPSEASLTQVSQVSNVAPNALPSLASSASPASTPEQMLTLYETLRLIVQISSDIVQRIHALYRYHRITVHRTRKLSALAKSWLHRVGNITLNAIMPLLL